MKICVMGLGYIGLPTSLLLAEAGHEVIGVDIDEEKVKELKSDELPFEEPGIKELFENAKDNFEPKNSIEPFDVYLIAVPTPLDSSLKIPDLKAIKSAAEMIGPHLKDDDLVILESTVPPGTSENLILPILRKYKKQSNFYLAHSPERAIPGNTIEEMRHNNRIIGGLNHKSSKLAKSIYTSFVDGKIHLTDLKTSEMVKLMENTFRDVNIALANEFAQMGEEMDIDVWEAIELANEHPRVDILNPGPGVGGHCISIDPWFLLSNSTTSNMISLAREINDSMPNFVVNKVRHMIDDIQEPTVTIFGVAYKGDVNDTRETPALKIIKLIENEGINVKCYDPQVREFEYDLYSLEEAVDGSDCILVVTDHKEFINIDPKYLENFIRNKNILDTRNILNDKKWKKASFKVKTLGKTKEE
ncbi:MAG: nucleotide sugar dehydrogenase [Promethearchaeia archaeon]